MQRLPGSSASTVATIEMTGVIPLPAATNAWWRPTPGEISGPKRPAGGSTSSRSPARSPSATKPENRPPGRCRTPTASSPLRAGTQIEYERRTSSPSSSRTIVTCWPASWAKTSARSSGTAKWTAVDSSVSGRTCVTSRRMRPPHQWALK